MFPAHTDDENDHGSLQTLEVIIVAMLMTSAVVFVATFEAPPAGAAASRSTLERQADDALAILYDTRVASGDDALSAFLLQCLQDDCRNLTRKLDKLLPQGAGYAVYVSHGGAVVPVYAPREPPGEAVTVRQLVEPDWSYTFLAPGLGSVNRLEDALPVYAMPVFKSTPLSSGGSPLLVRVHGTRAYDNSEYVMTAAASTMAGAATDATKTAAVSLYFADAAGRPLAASDVTSASLDSGGSPSLEPIPFRLRLDETAGVPVPAGTVLTVHTPSGFVTWADPAENAGTWKILSNSSDYNATFGASELRAELLAPVENGSVDFVFRSVYRGDDLDHYPFTAFLSRGAYSTATLVAKADNHDSPSNLEIPHVYLSAPKPMGASATTTWALSAHVPITGGSNRSIEVTKVEIIETEGNAIFGNATGLPGSVGAWSAEGDRLVWTGSERVRHGAPLNLTFQVNASGIGGPSDARSTFVAPVRFDSWTGRVVNEVTPGLYRGSFLPRGGDYQGYNGSTGGELSRTHLMRSDGVYRTTPIDGASTYQSGYFALLDDSLYGDYIEFERRQVPQREAVELTAHVQSTLYTLATLGFEANVTLRIHPPWAQGPHAPVYETTLFSSASTASGLLASLDSDGDGVPDDSAAGIYGLSLDIPDSWLFGTYLVEVHLEWREDVSENVGNRTLSETFTRHVSLFDTFVVTPPDGMMPTTPIYDVHLVVWMEDWG